MRGWLFGIASKLLARHFRDAQRRERATQRVASEPEPDQAGALERQLLGPALSAAVGDLPAVDREVLLLWAWAELEYSRSPTPSACPWGPCARACTGHARASVTIFSKGASDDRA